MAMYQEALAINPDIAAVESHVVIAGQHNNRQLLQNFRFNAAQFFDELQAGHAEQVIIDDGNVG